MMRYLLMLAICCFSSFIYAQDIKTSEFKTVAKKILLGWEVGVNKTYLKSGKKSEHNVFRFGKVYGYKIGTFLTVPLGKYYSLSNGLVFERKGAYSKGLDILYRLNYLSLSVTPSIHYKFLFLKGGLYAAYLLRATDDVPRNVIVIGAMTPDKFNRFELGLRLGAGIDFFKKVKLAFNYEHGISSAYDDPIYGANGHSTNSYWHRRNRAFSLSVRTTFKELQLGKITQ